MSIMDIICSRKSIRKYNDQAVTDAELKQVLKAAYAAPVGRARYETINLTVITNKDFLHNWEEAVGPGTHPFYGAPCVILVSSALREMPMTNVDYSNAAIVVHSMVLEAVELGLGACHIWGAVRTLNDHPELLKELNLPEGMTPCCCISLGHTDETYELREIPDERIKTTYLK